MSLILIKSTVVLKSNLKFKISKVSFILKRCHYSSGPVFGAGADLFISNNCNTNIDNYSNLPHTYDGDGASPSLLMGEYHFTVADYEVFIPVTSGGLKHIKSERY